jgi:hypothetical protein
VSANKARYEKIGARWKQGDQIWLMFAVLEIFKSRALVFSYIHRLHGGMF